MPFDAKVPVEIVAPDGRRWIRALGTTAFIQVRIAASGTNSQFMWWDEVSKEYTANDLREFEKAYSAARAGGKSNKWVDPDKVEIKQEVEWTPELDPLFGDCIGDFVAAHMRGVRLRSVKRQRAVTPLQPSSSYG